MTLSYRHRAVMVILVAFFGAPLVVGAEADASAGGRAGGDGQTVTFSGKPEPDGGAAACPSAPSVTHVTTSAGSVVHFVNRTGKPATLWVGDSRTSVPDWSLVPVTFLQGPMSIVVSMVPECPLDVGVHGYVAVRVAAPAPTASSSRAPALGPAVSLGKPTSATGLDHRANGLLIMVAVLGLSGVLIAVFQAINRRGATRAFAA
jgi:hypothetical protein